MIVKIITKIPATEVVARIEQISMKGLVTVKFKQNMVVPGNFTRFND